MLRTTLYSLLWHLLAEEVEFSLMAGLCYVHCGGFLLSIVIFSHPVFIILTSLQLCGVVDYCSDLSVSVTKCSPSILKQASVHSVPPIAIICYKGGPVVTLPQFYSLANLFVCYKRLLKLLILIGKKPPKWDKVLFPYPEPRQLA